MNVPKKSASQAPKVKVSGQPIRVERIINRVALKLELNRPAPEGFVPIIDGVVIDPEQDTYQLPGGARGFSANFLTRVQNAAGIQQTETYHRDCEIDGQSGIEVEVVAIRPRAGELPLQARAVCRMSYHDAYTRYLRKGADDSEKEKARERSFLPRKLETMAMNRCIAKLAGIKRAARQNDLITEHGPVVWAFRRDQLDMKRPDVMSAYVNAAAKSAGRLFGRDENEDVAPEELEGVDETVSAADPEFGAIADADYDDDTGWSVDDDEGPEPVDSETVDEEPFAEDPEVEDAEVEEPDLLPAEWPFDDDHEITAKALVATTKRELWAAMQDIDVATASLFLARWSQATGYDAEDDPDGIMATWNAKRGKDAQKAMAKVTAIHRGIG